jgi:hypothetical protein
MKKKIKVTFKRGTSSSTYLVESLTNIGALSVGPTKMVRVGDTVTSAEVDYVCERSRAEVFIRN